MVVTTLNKISADDLGLDSAVNEEENFPADDRTNNLSERGDRNRSDAELLCVTSSDSKGDTRKAPSSVDITFADADDPFSNISEFPPANSRPKFEDLDRFGLVPEHAPLH